MYRFYFSIFKRKFSNLSFHHPRTDTCKTCDLLNIKIKANPNDKESKRKLDLHHRQAEKAMNTMKEDHCLSQLPLSGTCSISIDLQQVLSLPALTHGQMFYLRQLSCYNFGIHVGDTNKGLMHLWHEGITGRGGNEIASCVLKTLLSGFTKKQKLVVWSDNCVGQNKNKMLLFLWIYLVTKGYFQEINQEVLMSGHSILSCDRDFAHIEKRKRVEKCEVPFDLVRLIATATPNNPFTVTLMQAEDFFDFKAAADLTLNTTRTKISTAKWIQVSADNPKQVKIRETLNEMEAWKNINVFKKNVTEQSIRDMVVPQLNCQNQIKENKKPDLRAVLPF
ncbi:uncharacterized protein LOC115878937 [Sitophilus oryzae]|uniref:Uncharacterized protein LOC115878937 n=1 Tax=Sitophilus oryzae TaxID=7048 RepID=A0A6J2XIW4_SITOR|nr:uncharacterized protein LOC115878937 [Sitophilus oryzae]